MESAESIRTECGPGIDKNMCLFRLTIGGRTRYKVSRLRHWDAEANTNRGNGLARHKSAMKRARQNEIRRLARRSKMRRLRTQLGKIRNAISEKNTEQVEQLLAPTLSLIDSSTHGSLIHRNKAARQKSRLMSQVNSLSDSPTSA